MIQGGDEAGMEDAEDAEEPEEVGGAGLEDEEFDDEDEDEGRGLPNVRGADFAVATRSFHLAGNRSSWRLLGGFSNGAVTSATAGRLCASFRDVEAPEDDAFALNANEFARGSVGLSPPAQGRSEGGAAKMEEQEERQDGGEGTVILIVIAIAGAEGQREED